MLNSINDTTVQPGEYRIIYKNNILDNVHGKIGLTAVEDAIERKPIFKRLQDISQLGLVKRIFPCALHNRYVHSLGVMYVADKMAIKLNLNDDERQVIRLAGLLHDIGHYPFSHDTERVYRIVNRAGIKMKVLPPTAYEDIEDLKKPQNIKIELGGHKDDPFHHEAIGALVIKNNEDIRECILNHYICNSAMMLKKCNELGQESVIDELLDDICAIVVGDCQHTSVLFPERMTLFVQMMHSELDADNIDYLLRDAAFSGTTYGIMDMQLLIDGLIAKPITFSLPNNQHDTLHEKVEQEHYILGIVPKGIGSVDQFMINRYLAYEQVIFSKYVSILGAMLRYVIRCFLTEEEYKEEYPFKDVKEIAKSDSNGVFLKFTDSTILSLINSQSPDSILDPLKRKIILALQKYRAFYLQPGDNDRTFSNLEKEKLYDVVRVEGKELCEELDELFSEIEAYNRSTENNLDKAHELQERAFAYQTASRSITKQLPRSKYEEILEKTSQEELETYYCDRLMNGVPVFDPNKSDEKGRPFLIVERQESILHSVYGQSFLKIRHYQID